MQPYLFPYLGYFQLMHATDKFVFYDDVSYIKNGWVNRNRILLGGKPFYITVPLARASSFRAIKDTHINLGSPVWKRKILGTLKAAYRDAPGRMTGIELFESVIGYNTDSISELARQSVYSVMDYLGLRRDVVPTSRIYSNGHLSGQVRVLDICLRERANIYVNLPGGQGLYSENDFLRAGIGLRFVNVRLPPYSQGGGEFVAGLSILDCIMYCSRSQIREMLRGYELVTSVGLLKPSGDRGLGICSQ